MVLYEEFPSYPWNSIAPIWSPEMTKEGSAKTPLDFLNKKWLPDAYCKVIALEALLPSVVTWSLETD